MGLTYLYTRLEVSLDTLAIAALFEESDAYGLEALSDSLSCIMTETTLSELYTDITIRDLLEVHAFCTKDIEINQVFEDFQVLTALIRSRIDQNASKHYGWLRAIHLEYPNTLILEYAKYTPKVQIDISRFRREPRCRRSSFR